MNAPAYVDPYLTLPLHGLRLVEASAGTGKTFTLATLVTRLVVEQGLRVGQVLAVTFTEAATQDLRKRIRERLECATRVAEGMAESDAAADVALSRDIIERHLAGSGESRARLAQRLRQAALEIDLAGIFTIHGFCTRVLREHALESGHAFAAPTLLTSDAALREELAADLWRALAASPEDALLLPGLWSTPTALRDDLRVLLGRDPLRPEPGEPGEDPTPALEAAADGLCASISQSGDEARAAIAKAFDDKVLDGHKARRSSFDKAWENLCKGVALRTWTLDGKNHVDKLLPRRLRELCKEGRAEEAPCSRVFDALATWVAASEAHQCWLQARAIALLHRVRAEAHARLADLKRVRQLQTFDDLIDGVADALEGAHGEALVAALRAQYRCALVDEFQDTDPRQWAIFRRVFGEAHAGAVPALFLIGDPKQAIYRFRGGDVHTYLQAAGIAERAPPLDRNFRSRPALLLAIARLYDAAGATAFVDDRIRFHPVHAGGRRRDADFQRNGAIAPALTVRRIERDPDDAQAASFSAERSRALATRACVAAIHALLEDARAGRASIDGRALQAGDIAVLVRKHQEATRIQRALAAAGIPAVAAGRLSLFASEEARDLLALFEALLQPADDGRLRAALATLLLGLDAAAIAALDHDAATHARYQREAQDWRERWRRGGPFALVADLCAAAGPRLLALLDGERRLTNYLQVGEMMQDAQRRAPGLHAQLDWLRNAIAEADPDDEAQLLRLESDARRVQIVTLHKSKGLEYPLVFLPFVGIGGKGGTPSRHCMVRAGDGRALQWQFDTDDGGWRDAVLAHAREEQAEDARLLYVGLTRAEHALWLASGPFYNAAKAPLAPMLSDLPALRGQPGIVVDDAPLAPPPPPLPVQAEASAAPARIAQRVLAGDWWMYSFTQLVKSEPGARAVQAIATLAERGAEDEAGDAMAGDARFGGSRFGNVLHDVLEHADFGAWRAWRDGAAAPEEAVLRAALAAGGYAEHEQDAGLAALLPLVGHTLTTPLPEGGRLCDLPDAARRAEMEFHFPLQPTVVDRLIDLLHAHDVLRDRMGFGGRRRLEGLMTGKIDLAYTRDGRWYVLDYKSNRLPAYDRDGMAEAMAHSGYDLQALLYTLALHRWLRFRLGDAYDYARDFGGVRYLFCRGLVMGDGAGVYEWTPPSALLHALDSLFAAQATLGQSP